MNLDRYQEAARVNMDEKVLLVAPPGSGKTTVLLAKIDHLIDEQGILPQEILVLTFSRAASLNLKARFSKGREKTPFFGTIHSFAYREIKKREGQISLIDSYGALHSLKSVGRRFHLTQEEVSSALGDISRERSTGVINEEVPAKFREEVRKAYFGYKAEKKLLDFDDLEERLLEFLGDAALRAKITGGYRWILVDEFQDLNKVQLRILKLLSEHAHLFCVGDEDQCIYAFRGSDTGAMIRFPDEFHNGRILYLKYNYRSSATVIRYANELIRCNKERYPKEIVNFRQDETPVVFELHSDERSSLQKAAEGLDSLKTSESASLIFRTNAELSDAAHSLCRKGFTFTILDQVYDRYETRLLGPFIEMIRYALTGGDNKDLFLKIMERNPVNLSQATKQRLARSPIFSEADLLDPKNFDLPLKQREDLAVFFKDVRKLRKMKPKDAVSYILYVMGVCHDLDKRAERTGESLTDLLKEVEDFAKEAGSFPTTKDYIRYLDSWKRIMDRRDPESQIVLSTMHGVKGMEFDRVYVMNAAEGLIPHERSFNEMEAERRLFYVALTRARHHLHVHTVKSWQGRPVKISRFIPECGADVIDQSSGSSRFRFLQRYLI